MGDTRECNEFPLVHEKPKAASSLSRRRKLFPTPRWIFVVIFMGIIGLSLLAPTVIAGEHGEDGKLEHVVTTDNKTGISLFLADLYNNHRFLYSLFVTMTMAILGMVVALVTEVGLKLLGVKKALRLH